jgi:hypothetical protein
MYRPSGLQATEVGANLSFNWNSSFARCPLVAPKPNIPATARRWPVSPHTMSKTINSQMGHPWTPVRSMGTSFLSAAITVTVFSYEFALL